MMQGMSVRRVVASLVTLPVLAAGLLVAGHAGASATDPPRTALAWGDCPDDIPKLPPDDKVRCAKLRLPVDWSAPGAATFDLTVARRPARHQDRRVGTLVFAPGGPGDSGVERIRRGDRFSTEILDRFDTVSFDPRGVARSGGATCPAVPEPPLLLADQAAFDRAVAANRRMWAACAPTSPVWEHAGTLDAVRDLDALRAALGERRLTFHGSSYGTLLGEQYAERYPGRVRAMVLESVFDHSLGVPAFVRSQAATLQDSFDEFVAWCANAAGRCPGNVRAVWRDVLRRADEGAYRPYTAFDIATLPIARLNGPNWPGLAQDITDLAAGRTPARIGVPPVATAVFCADWPADVPDHRAYARLVRAAAAAAPDVRYGAGLLAVRICLGWPQPVANPPHRLRVHTRVPLLLLNAVHDPRTGYDWATNVRRQLGRHGRLVTYEGWGHGSYGASPCTTAAVDRYLIDLVVPPRGARCPAA